MQSSEATRLWWSRADGRGCEPFSDQQYFPGQTVVQMLDSGGRCGTDISAVPTNNLSILKKYTFIVWCPFILLVQTNQRQITRDLLSISTFHGFSKAYSLFFSSHSCTACWISSGLNFLHFPSYGPLLSASNLKISFCTSPRE